MEQNNRVQNKQSQILKNVTSDGIDVEYSAELADQNDIQAQERANAADQRAKRNN